MNPRHCRQGHPVVDPTARFCPLCGVPLDPPSPQALAAGDRVKRQAGGGNKGGAGILGVLMLLAGCYFLWWVTTSSDDKKAQSPPATPARQTVSTSDTREPTAATGPRSGTLRVDLSRSETPTRRPLATGVAKLASATVPLPVTDPSSLDAAFLRDVTVPDGTAVSIGAEFTKTWAIKNTGAVDWPEGTVLRHVGGSDMGIAKSVHVAQTRRGASVEVPVPMRAPSSPGSCRSDWRLCSGETCFGTTLFVQILAVDSSTLSPTSPPPATPTPEGPRWYYSGKSALAISKVDRRRSIGYWTADAGSEYVSVAVSCGNCGTSGTVHCNPFDIRLMTGDGVIYSHSWLGQLEPQLQAVDLTPGAVTQGWVTFEVPAGDTGLQVVWDPSLFSDSVFIPLP